MDKEQLAINNIKKQAFLPLFYHEDAAIGKEVVQALYEAGVRSVEFTNRGAKALENFTALCRQRDAAMPGLQLGAGTIKTSDDAAKFIHAGADFLISPVFDSGVCDVAYMNKILWMPGCMTPTEIHVAEQAGCRMIKLFPGNVLGPGFVEAITPLFTNLAFVVTGGVDITDASIGAWLKSGVAAVGLGSKLIGKQVLQNKSYSELRKTTGDIMQIVSNYKKA
jgi:2-dehydro-3-deoxyphosphogluconate aldolase / (4S)-4-hydroxy-2-oxoglutarate aldolase